MNSHVYTNVKTFLLVHFKYVQIIVYQLNFKKLFEKKIMQDKVFDFLLYNKIHTFTYFF